MQKWEYLERTTWRKENEPGNWRDRVALDELGEDGWELVSAYPVSNGTNDWTAGATHEVVYVFKRPI